MRKKNMSGVVFLLTHDDGFYLFLKFLTFFFKMKVGTCSDS